MSEKSNKSLETVSMTFSLERHNFEEYLNQQRAYQSGVEEFARKFSKLPEPLFQNLQHEAGLAEVYLQKGELLKYSIHLYRQLEILFNSIFGVENSDVFPFNKTFLKKVLQEIKWDDLKKVQRLICSNINNLTGRSKDGKFYYFKKGESICRIDTKNWPPRDGKIEFFNKKDKRKYYIDYNSSSFNISDEKKLNSFHEFIYQNLEKIIADTEVNLEFSQREFLFKILFYYSGTTNELRAIASDINKDQKVYLNAFVAIRFFRNVGSHNNFDNQTLSQKGFSLRLDNSERKYWDNPELILKSNYFQQYLNMVYRCYIEHLENPYF